MYCRMCGNKTGDSDHYCQVCGTPTGYKEPPAAPAETSEMKEEIVFNPPYENKAHFTEEDSPYAEEERSEPEEEEEDLKEFISENEIEAQKNEEETINPGAVKDGEFAWNIYEFPGSKKTEEIAFNWNMEEFNQAEPKEGEPTPFEEEFFQEIRDDSNRIKEQNIDRFFTFSRKNEEFQELLDKEYEKLNRNPEPGIQVKVVKESGIPEVVPLQEIHMDSVVPEEAQYQETPLDTEIPIEETVLNTEPVEENDPNTEPVEETVQKNTEPVEIEEEAELTIEDEPAQAEAAQKSEHLSEMAQEMAQARALFFGEELIRDNESIKKKLVADESGERPESLKVTSSEPEPEEESAIKPDDAVISADTFETEEPKEDIDRRAESVAAAYSLAASEKAIELEHSAAPIPVLIGEEDEEEEGENHKRSIGQILLVILAIILFIEIAILGIRYFAPESAASKVISNTQTQIFNTVSGWTDGIKDLFSGNDSNEDEDKTGDNEDETNPDQGVPLSEEEPDDTVTENPAPDPNPNSDKNALVSSQLGNNSNIEQVKANEALAYQTGKDYGLADINNSKPITNNIWQTPENEDPVYYDESIVGTVIAFDSQWIDYVNGGSKSVLELLKKDSEAYQKAVKFSKVGKIKETFKLLEIGEIRQGSKGFYIWAHEELQIVENGKATYKKYNWIYYLEPTDGKMQIVNYFNF